MIMQSAPPQVSTHLAQISTGAYEMQGLGLNANWLRTAGNKAGTVSAELLMAPNSTQANLT